MATSAISGYSAVMPESAPSPVAAVRSVATSPMPSLEAAAAVAAQKIVAVEKSTAAAQSTNKQLQTPVEEARLPRDVIRLSAAQRARQLKEEGMTPSEIASALPSALLAVRTYLGIANSGDEEA